MPGSITARSGSVLLLSLMLLAFMVTIASTFLISMSRYRAVGRNVVLRTQAEVAMRAGKAHAVQVLQRHAMEPTTGSVTSVASGAADRFSGRASNWVREFEADVTLEPGGSWPVNEPPAHNMAEQTVRFSGIGTWSRDKTLGDILTSDTFNDGFWDMLGWYQGSSDRDIGTDMHIGAIQGSRFFDVAHLDANFQPVAEPDARYVVRYAVLVYDLTGMINLNFMPEEDYSLSELGSGPGSLRERLADLRQRYAMNLMSLYGVDGHLGQFWSAQNNVPLFAGWVVDSGGSTLGPVDPTLRTLVVRPEELALKRHCTPFSAREDGWLVNRNSALYRNYYGHRVARLLEGRGVHTYQGLLRSLTPGPVLGWGGIGRRARYIANYKQNAYGLSYTPFTRGLRAGHGLARRTALLDHGEVDDVDTPWHFNILTMPQFTGRLMLHGWTSQVRYARGEGGYNGFDWRTADLLPYADGVALRPSIAGGRHDDNYVPLNDATAPMRGNLMSDSQAGDGSLDAWYERTGAMRRWFYGLRGNEGRAIGPRQSVDYAGRNFWSVKQGKTLAGGYLTFGNRAALSTSLPADGQGGAVFHESYEFDIVDALAQAVEIARFAWGGRRAYIGNYAKSDADPLFFSSADKDSEFAQADWAALRGRLQSSHDVERLFLHILGEEVGGGRHDPRTWRALPRVLAGQPVRLETGVDPSSGFAGWFVPQRIGEDQVDSTDLLDLRDASDDLAAVALLRPEVDTAGMERLLNDVRMSFFGSPALDFNYDGWAESSVNGFNDGYGNLDNTAGGNPYGGPKHDGREVSGGRDRYAPGYLLDADDPDSKAVVAGGPSGWRDDLLGWFPVGSAFTVSGRLYMGKSQVFRVLTRGEVWDRAVGGKIAQRMWDMVYVPNPSDRIQRFGMDMVDDVDVSDGFVLYQRPVNSLLSGRKEGL